MTANLPNEESELLSRMAAGEENAFRVIFQQYFRRLCFFADSLIGNMEDSKDIAQEALYQVWTRRQHFNTTTNLKSFLYITTRNASLNYLKTAHRRTARHIEMERMLEANNDLLEINTAREEVLQMILLELESIPSKYSNVLKLIFIQGLNYQEIAERLALPLATVRKQKERGLKFLQAAVLRKKLLTFLILSPLAGLFKN